MGTSYANRKHTDSAPSKSPQTAADLARVCIGLLKTSTIPKFPIRSNISNAKKWAIKVCNMLSINGSCRKLLIELAIHAREYGIAYPSSSTLADEMGVSIRTVRRARSKLNPIAKQHGIYVYVEGVGRKHSSQCHFAGSPAMQLPMTLEPDERTCNEPGQIAVPSPIA